MSRWAVAIAFAVGCTTPPASPKPNFELDCDSSDTATKTELYCVRTDTRSGEVLRVNYLSLPASNGPTAAATTGPAGLFTTECHATYTDTRSDFYCIRLNTDNGEMMLINLQKVGVFPKT
jgi:hypothetical protein